MKIPKFRRNYPVLKRIRDGKTITRCINQNLSEEKMGDGDTPLVKHSSHMAEEENE